MNKLFVIVVVLVVLCGLAACGNLPGVFQRTATPVPGPRLVPSSTPTSQPTPTPEATQGTISIWHSWDESRLPALLKQIVDFQEQYPNVQFDVLYVPALDLLRSYQQACIEGFAPDILLGQAEWGPQLLSDGCIRTLELDGDGDGFVNLNQAAVETNRYQGELIGIPLVMDGVVLYRNPQIVPIEAATFTELIELSQRASEGEQVGAYLDRSPYFSGGHLFGLGGNFFDAQGRPVFNDEYGLVWTRLLQQFEGAGPADYFTDQDYQLFLDGSAGYLIETTQRREALRSVLGDGGVVIDPWPIYEQGNLAGFIQVESAFFHARTLSEPHSISRLFIDFLLTPEGQLELVKVGMIPVISGLVEVGFTTRVEIEDPLIAQAMVALLDAVPYPLELANPEVRATLDTYLQAILAGDLQPGDGLNQAAAIIASQVVSPTVMP